MEDDARVTIRMPKELHEALKQVAAQEHRSASNLVLHALREYPAIREALAAH